ncbi:MAG: FKBP-type peptidyl-prolyl cis-trans isomerase [Oscillospiraceae bacterium]|nr:FKBP-type peptidyl-prolyl cis-trans isomerase [Oscillospiraceae bacterium]
MLKKTLRLTAILLAMVLIAGTFTACISPKEFWTNLTSSWKDEEPYGDYDLDEYIKLGEYKGISVVMESEEFTTAEISAYAKSLFDQYGQSLALKPIEGKTVVENGDVIDFNYTGTADGLSADILANMTADNAVLEIGSNQFIDGFEEQLIGKEIGKDFEIGVTFPTDYDTEELRGKDVVFACKINVIGEQTITDDAVNSLTGGQMTTVADFMTYCEEDLVNNAVNANTQAAADAAIANAEVLQIPARERQYYYDQFQIDVEGQSMDVAEYLSSEGYTGTPDDYKENEFDTRIKQDLFVFAVAEKENITVTEDELTEQVDYFRSYRVYNGDDESLLTDDYIYKTYGKGFFIRSLMTQKVFQFVYNNAVRADAAETVTTTAAAQ